MGDISIIARRLEDGHVQYGCTRAKYRIAFIGNLNDWKNRRYFREFIPKFIDTIDA